MANHKGYFEFSLCERDDPNQRETEECFEKRVLELADETGTRFHIPRDDNGFYVVPIKIPRNVSCAHCVLRWHWRSGKDNCLSSWIDSIISLCPLHIIFKSLNRGFTLRKLC